MEKIILQILGAAAGIIGFALLVVLFAYYLFKFYGQKWIENRFAERLSKLKHEQSQELESYRLKINALFSRITKIHEKEFEVLPEAWKKLQEALGRISSFVSPLKYRKDLDGMEPEVLIEFLEKSILKDYEKDQVKKASNKQECYYEIIYWYDLNEAWDALREYHRYVLKNIVFIRPPLHEEFKKISDIMREAIINMEMTDEESKRELWHAAYKKIKDEATPIRDNIQNMIQDRLRLLDAD
jgi:hypothetical protein